jgi:hypothetical protein
MNDRADPDSIVPLRKLSQVIREVKNAAADREDVVVELREATRTRLQLLAAELAPVFAEVPADIDLFDFAISSGLQPRLWIDSVSHVAMGRDRRTYRFVKDTRNGRIVLAESPKIDVLADKVTRYVAERIVEREQTMEGDVTAAVEGVLHARAAEPEAAPAARQRRRMWSNILSGAWIFITGIGFGLAVAIALLWERLTGALQ